MLQRHNLSHSVSSKDDSKYKVNSRKCNECSCIVYRFVREAEKQNNFMHPIPEDIIAIFFMFYHEYMLKLENPKNATPFTLLFAMYHLRTALSDNKCMEWKKLDNKQQCQYLRKFNQGPVTKEIKLIIHEICDINAASNMYEKLLCISSNIHQENQLLSTTISIADWSQHDLIISFMHHLIIKEYLLIAKYSETWEFVEYLRRYFQCTEYDGAIFYDDIADVAVRYYPSITSPQNEVPLVNPFDFTHIDDEAQSIMCYHHPMSIEEDNIPQIKITLQMVSTHNEILEKEEYENEEYEDDEYEDDEYEDEEYEDSSTDSYMRYRYESSSSDSSYYKEEYGHQLIEKVCNKYILTDIFRNMTFRNELRHCINRWSQSLRFSKQCESKGNSGDPQNKQLSTGSNDNNNKNSK